MEQLLSALVLMQSELPEDFPVDMETLMMISLVITLVSVVIGIVAGYWVYKDAAKRENNGTVWAIAVGLSFLLFPIGLVVPIAYFVLRSDETPTEPETASAAGDW
ncbi:hypothetical protein [Halalkalicoccus jeotgali]|uniref:Cardiolipin synthase N-terminal domain-containing protein n=1 Tax=Halalkalicoccus jeotgali (strain DSM 18796 / CECT 7217 / JCM 14584 / KCTC 4019 / B3) TaxID=795797 RepID=D8J5B1_HALJB|nr:hypothetical protein [Halalkalicoccus jeotgali]ADJ13692.1 hypothetical protein HacjB3_01495 [Halalkalicoccus jeotgali B3]ELY34261.1 hypothetical protein C497_17827 [Halalkalicoccus jeotgali B3]